MDQKTRDSARLPGGRIDRWLDSCLRDWEGLPAAEAEIDGWDPDDQVDYVIEWGPRLERLRGLERYAESGDMTEDQLGRYERLVEVVRENQPVLDRLRET
jgi:hypothetical protein